MLLTFLPHNMKFFLLAPLLLLLSSQTHSVQYGVVTPQNPFAFEGESLRLYCNITNPLVRENSSSLFFERGQERRPSQELNTRAIRLMVPHVILSDQGSYVCLVRTMEGKVKVVDSQYVNVDVKPRQVKNVTCRVYNWEEMTCTWDLGIHYRHPHNVNVSLFWVTTTGQVVLPEDVQHDCPWLSNNSCHWDRDHYKHGLHYSIRIAVTYGVKDHREEQASKMIHINTQELVEPAPVVRLRASATNSTCIKLTWEIPRVMHREKSFPQQIRTPGTEIWRDIISAPSTWIKEKHSSHSSLVCNLDRNSRYEFRVAVLPLYLGRQTGPSSDWRVTSAYTEEDVPSGAPMICSGCFFDIPEAEEDIAGSRKVRIMWKAIPKHLLHGTLTHYKISYWSMTSHYSSTVFSYAIDDTKPVTSADLKLPSRQQDYRVSVVGATRKGESLNASSILIPAIKKKPAPPQRFLVKRNREEQSSGRFFLSWATLESEHVNKRRSAPLTQRHASSMHAPSGLHIVWCARSRDRWQCQGELNWVRLPPTQVTYELKTNINQGDPYDPLIGIAVEVNAGHEVISSGIYWSQCVYTRNQKPNMAPQDVRFSPIVTADSLVVTWRKPECREEPAYITEYLVRYCPSSSGNKCIGDRTTLNVSGEVTEITLPHLARNTKYLVHVEAVSSAGLGPPSADIWRMVEPKPPDEDLSSLILIVVSIMCVLIVVTSCVCFIRCCYTKNQKLPAVDGLLEIQPTQKSRPNIHHHRDRPLPEPPSEAHVEHHTYGTHQCSAHACMKSHGYEEFQVLTETEHLLEDAVHINRYFVLQNEKSIYPEALQGQSHIDSSQVTNDVKDEMEKTSLLNSVNEDSIQLQDSSVLHPDKNQGSAVDIIHDRAQSYQRISFIETPGTPGKGKNSSVGSYVFQIPGCSNILGDKKSQFIQKDSIPLHSPLSHSPIVLPVICNDDMFKNVNPTSDAIIPLSVVKDNVCPTHTDIFQKFIEIPQINETTPETCQLSPEGFFTLPILDQDFCTCDTSSDDSQSVDINANVAPAYKIDATPTLEDKCDFSSRLDLSLPFPRFAVSQSPSLPPQPAPPVPIEDTDNDVQESHDIPAINSLEYLEPTFLSSGYCAAGVS